MKKIWIFATVLALAVSFGACKGTSEPVPSTEPVTQPSEHTAETTQPAKETQAQETQSPVMDEVEVDFSDFLMPEEQTSADNLNSAGTTQPEQTSKPQTPGETEGTTAPTEKPEEAVNPTQPEETTEAPTKPAETSKPTQPETTTAAPTQPEVTEPSEPELTTEALVTSTAGTEPDGYSNVVVRP